MTDKMKKEIQMGVGRMMGALCDVPGYVATEGEFSFEDGKVNITISVEETEPKTIYAGTEDYVEFFKTTISTLGLENVVDYSVEIVDGEYEIVIR